MRIQINKTGLEYPNIQLPPRKSSEGIGGLYFHAEEHKYIVTWYCPRCATESYGLWKFYESLFSVDLRVRNNSEYEVYRTADEKCREHFRSLIKGEVGSLKCENFCPLCGATLSIEPGYSKNVIDSGLGFYKDYGVHLHGTTTSEILDEAYKLMYERRIEDAEKQSKNIVAKMLKKYEALDIPSNYEISQKNKIVNDLELLKEYLLRLIKLESSIRSVSERLVQLYVEKTESDRQAYQSELLASRTVKSEIDEAQNHYQECIVALKNIENLEMSRSGFSIPDEPKKPNEPCYEKVSIFNRKKAEAHNQLLKQQYEMACAEYDNSMQVYLQEVQRIKKAFEEYVINRQDEAQKDVDAAKRNLDELSNNADMRTKELLAEPTPQKIIKNMIDKEVDDAKKLLKELIECKNKLFGYDVVFEKYRDIVALSSFYEYLMAGRCDSLSGANGAYNIYENEARAKQIITKLVEISETLEEIRDSQYMIYSELCSINSNLSDLKESMNEAMREIKSGMGAISKQLDDISYYTKVTAYYSKMNASLTNAIGFMIALN